MIVPAVVLSPGLLLAALSGVTQPVRINNADPTSVEDKSFMVSSLNQVNFLQRLVMRGFQSLRNSRIFTTARLRSWMDGYMQKRDKNFGLVLCEFFL